MASSEEMRRVMVQASDKLTKARQKEGWDSDRLRRLEIASAYGSGVPDLLASYLEVTDDEPPRASTARERDPATGRFLPSDGESTT